MSPYAKLQPSSFKTKGGNSHVRSTHGRHALSDVIPIIFSELPLASLRADKQLNIDSFRNWEGHHWVYKTSSQAHTLSR